MTNSSFCRYEMVHCAFFVLTVTAALACGETEADKANRTSLAPLLQRTQALTSEIAAAVETHHAETWANKFERFEGYIKEKQAIQKDLRGVVPTAKYSCIVGVLNRSLADDINMLQARLNSDRQAFRFVTSFDQAKRYRAEAASSEYSARMYINMARESLKEAQKANESVLSFARAADSAARIALARADTLRFLTLKSRLLPEYALPVYQLETDTAHKVIQGIELKEASCT